MTKEAERLAEYKTRARSWSQLNQFESCPAAYYLSRIANVWEKPDAWRPMGTALHSAIEAREKTQNTEGILEVAQRAYKRSVNEQLAETPNAGFWHRSGPYRGPEDIPRRYSKLAEHLDRYEVLREQLPPMLPGGVEHELSADLDGVEVIGFADQIREGLIVDLKTGSIVPKDPSQLALYAHAWYQETGQRIDRGAFVMTGVGKKGRVIKNDLTTVSLESLTARFRKMDDGVKAEEFDPTPGDGCGRCGVITSCPAGQAYVRENR